MMHSWSNYTYYGHMPFDGFGPFAVLGVIGILIVAVIFVIALVLKGYALWHAAKRDEKGWFVALLILNTAGILELVYLIFVVKKWQKGTKGGMMTGNETSTHNG